MIPYIVIYIIILFLSFFAEKASFKNKKKTTLILLIFCVIILSLFAGLRTVDLGYDTKTYVWNTYKWVLSGRSLPEIFNIYGLEKGFISYVYFLCQINDDFNFVLFFLNLPVNIICIYFIYYYRKKMSIPLLMTIYYCTIYAFSFNIVRQCLTLSIFLLILILLDKKNYVISLILFVLGCFIHNSMIFSILTLLIIKFDNSAKLNRKYKMLFYIFMVVFLIFIITFNRESIQFAYNLGLISEKYLNYLSSESSDYREIINIEYSLLFLKSAFIVLALLYFNIKSIPYNDKEKNRKWLIMLIIDFIITFLSFKLANTDRISWYLYYPAIFMFSSELKNIFKAGKKGINAGNLIVGLVFVVYLLEKLITNQYRICPYDWIF